MNHKPIGVANISPRILTHPKVDVHLEPGRLHIRNRFRQTSALGPLMEALERLLRDEMTFGLMPQQVDCTHDLVMSAFDHLSSCSCGPVRVGDFSDGG